MKNKQKTDKDPRMSVNTDGIQRETPEISPYEYPAGKTGSEGMTGEDAFFDEPGDPDIPAASDAEPETGYTVDDADGKNRIVPGTLYLVATPIGNLSDLSVRAAKVLAGVSFIAAEDTRNSQKLLTLLGIRNRLTSYHEHNKASKGEEICQRLQAGDSCALITDAGMPAISDPGEDLVRLCAERGIPVTCVPGCCASVTGLALSGLDTSRFVFEGFLPATGSQRKQRLGLLRNETRTMMFHEAPHRLRQTLADFRDIFGDTRKMAICRELTKINETVLRLSVGEAVAYYTERAPRGEYVLIVAGAPDGETADDAFWTEMTLEEHVAYYLSQGLSRGESVKAVARDRNLPKNAVYNQVMKKDGKAENG